MTTATQEESQSGFLDIIKLLIAAGVLVGGLYGYYYLLEWTLPLRVLLVLGGLIVGVAIAMTSTQGRRLWAFHPGFARRDPQGRMADEAGDHANRDCRVRLHVGYGFVLLGAGLVPALADAHAGRLIASINTEQKGKKKCRNAGTSCTPTRISSTR